MTQWFSSLAQQAIVLPVAALCYLPMGRQLKYSKAAIAALCAGALALYCVIAAAIQTALHLTANLLLLPALLACFPLYRLTLKTDFSCALAIYVSCCALETFPAQFANVLEFRLYPETVEFSLTAALFQLGLTLLMLALAWPFRRRVGWMVDHLDLRRVWWSVTALSGAFLVFSVASTWEIFDVISAGSPYHLFVLMLVCALGLLICTYVLFYQGSRLLVERARTEQHAQLLEMQSHQYRALQEHIRQTARLRHDFRHSLRLLSSLAEQGKLEDIRAHLAEYERGEAPVGNWCANAALNALFCHYYELAAAGHIRIDWKFQLPEPLTVSELDLAGLFGNLIENGIEGCQTLPEGRRYFSLTAQLQPDGGLYIVSTNSFDGHVKKIGSGYRSTKHSGSGLGLASIAAVAEKYGGMARFSNTEQEFLSDVLLWV